MSKPAAVQLSSTLPDPAQTEWIKSSLLRSPRKSSAIAQAASGQHAEDRNASARNTIPRQAAPDLSTEVTNCLGLVS